MIVRYIENQEKHHRRKSFRYEYLTFLQKFEIEFKEEYVFKFYTWVAGAVINIALLTECRGYVPFAQVGVELLFQVISERAERATLVLTTNLPFSEYSRR